LLPGGSGLRFAVVRCDECGLHFTSPRPDPATIGQFYRPGDGPGRLYVGAGRVILSHGLEHAHDPLVVLTDARRLLGPGGRLTVTVPNFDSMSFRWFGAGWVGLDLPRHLTHFTPATLRRMLEQAGFGVIGLRQFPRADWLRSSALLATRHSRSPLWQRALTLKPLALLASWGCYLAGQSDTLMATAEAG
jgi:SAM-dependent methyltransferase